MRQCAAGRIRARRPEGLAQRRCSRFRGLRGSGDASGGQALRFRRRRALLRASAILQRPGDPLRDDLRGLPVSRAPRGFQRLHVVRGQGGQRAGRGAVVYPVHAAFPHASSPGQPDERTMRASSSAASPSPGRRQRTSTGRCTTHPSIAQIANSWFPPAFQTVSSQAKVRASLPRQQQHREEFHDCFMEPSPDGGRDGARESRFVSFPVPSQPFASGEKRRRWGRTDPPGYGGGQQPSMWSLRWQRSLNTMFPLMAGKHGMVREEPVDGGVPEHPRAARLGDRRLPSCTKRNGNEWNERPEGGVTRAASSHVPGADVPRQPPADHARGGSFRSGTGLSG